MGVDSVSRFAMTSVARQGGAISEAAGQPPAPACASLMKATRFARPTEHTAEEWVGDCGMVSRSMLRVIISTVQSGKLNRALVALVRRITDRSTTSMREPSSDTENASSSRSGLTWIKSIERFDRQRAMIFR
jgi:hypothetical protein